MKQKKAVSILCLVLAAIMVLSLVFSVLPVRAYAVSQSDIDAMKAKRSEITKRKQEAQGVVDGLKEEEAGVLVKKDALDENIAATEDALNLVAEEIAMYNDIIAEKEQELKAALKEIFGNPERYRIVEENARALARRNHDGEKIREYVRSMLAEAARIAQKDRETGKT